MENITTIKKDWQRVSYYLFIYFKQVSIYKITTIENEVLIKKLVECTAASSHCAATYLNEKKCACSRDA